MKRIAIAAVLYFTATVAFGQSALIAHTSVGWVGTPAGTLNAPVTTSPINTTTAGANNLILLGQASYEAPPAPTDNCGNTYAAVNGTTGYGQIHVFYAARANMCASHTFTFTGGYGNAGDVMVFSNVIATVQGYDQQNSGTGTNTSGTVSPTSNDEVVATFLYQPSVSTPTVAPGSLSLLDVTAYNGGLDGSFGIADAYEIQTTATPINATWTAAGNLSVSIVTFYSTAAPPALQFTTTSLPNGLVGTPYNLQLGILGGTPPYTVTLSSGTLPGGYSLSSSGLISGTPSALSSATALTFEVTDSVSAHAYTSGLTLTTTDNLAITTLYLPPAKLSQAASIQLAGSGGLTSGYVWSITSGTLPSPLTMSSGGLITGTPTVAWTPRALTFQLTDGAGTVTSTMTLTDGATTLDYNTYIATSALLTGSVGTPYSFQMFTNNKTSTYTWTETGTLESGLSMSTSGLISGTPTAAGTPSITFTISDGTGSVATATLTLTVLSAPTLNLGLGTCSNISTGTQRVAFSGCTIAATGGTPPYTYSWNTTNSSYSSIPEGLSLNTSTGAISGTFTGEGTYSPLFQVNDSTSATANLTTLLFGINGNNSYGFSIFPTGSIFHMRIDSLPVDTSPMSARPNAVLAAPEHMGFGGTLGGGNGIPISLVPYGTALTNVVASQGSFFLQAPVPGNSSQESTSNGGSGDHHVLVIKAPGGTDQPKLFELYGDTQNMFNSSTNTWNIYGDAYYGCLSCYNMLAQDITSADAAGLPITPLLYNADEVLSGQITGVKRITLYHTGPHIWPATNQSTNATCTGGGGENANSLVDQANPPLTCTNTYYPGYVTAEGTIFRVTAAVYANPPDTCLTDTVNFPQASVIFTQMRQYGQMVADNGGNNYTVGTPDYRWNDADLTCLKTLHGGDLEPVYTSGLQAVPDSVSSYQTVGSSYGVRRGVTIGSGSMKVGSGSVKVSQ